ncbi:hypothetical protein I4I73_29040 [Pseudonocardia sp. KRD-184]|uniref:MmpS family membrane protein n=1 Tax=Pseudonocardia oceani TaxID=2792013 RepID=A0ABS6U550_9PSEU|nr:MmpS family transport accessory protein [Pseudonocardia oceani]MBW0093274.1 hypothetical protein [Pseudonocardia oceani]MBW0100031.1 hypothetical protein [Pseudonocardia oceani]MBW0112882.1 hypothetical protein [Pseudonocardia oceani]MBW0124564.1 hypothetical protein [Pseudonocardia oceani]MBW0127034.1 hypothetical protein [Pseudonocardia oceani]
MAGAAAAVAVAVPIALTALGGPGDGPGTPRAGETVAFGTSADSEPAGAVATGDPAATPEAAEVVFEVTGSGTAGVITYSRGQSVGQISAVELPWRYTVPATGEPTDYSVAAAGASGEVSCRIVVDGIVVAEATDSEFSAVACSGRL